jgi:signal transduction histidine kinase
MRKLNILFLITLLSVGFVSAQGSKETAYTSQGDSLVRHLFNQASYNPSVVLDASKKLQIQALRRNDSILFAKALVLEAKSVYNLSHVTEAMAKTNAAISIFNLYNAPDGLLLAYYELGIIEGSSGNFFQALLKLKKCLSLSRQLNDERWRGRILYEIAFINYLQNENDLAWNRSVAAQQAVSAAAQPAILSQILSLQAKILIRNNDIIAATEKTNQAQAIASQTNDSLAYEKVYSTTAFLQLAKQNFAEAESAAIHASRISSKMGSPYCYLANQLLLSKVYLALDNVASALSTASTAYSKATSLDNMPLLQRDAALTLSEVFLSRGDSAKAYMYMSRVKYLDDSVLSDEVNKFVLLPAKPNNTNGHSNDFDEPVSENSNSGIFDDDDITTIIVGVLFLICAVLTILLIRKKGENAKTFKASHNIEEPAKREEPLPTAASVEEPTKEDTYPQPEPVNVHNHPNDETLEKVKALEYQLLEQQRLAQETKSELDARNKHFEEMDKTKNKVFSVLTHDLRQPINQIKSVLNLLEMEQLDGDDRREIVEKLKESVDNSSNALENLLLWSKKQLTGISTRLVDVHLLPQVWQLESHLKPNFEAKNIKFEIIIPDFFKVRADMNQLDICLRNLLTNAIKFSDPGGTITIDAIEENGQKIIRVIDQGVGMNPDQLEKLRGNAENFTTLGTMNEKGTGLGIMITKEFMENQEGKLDIMSRKGEGSIFSLIFPASAATRQ